MDINLDKLNQDFQNSYNDFISSLDKPTILIAGSTGCGKSTLCNLVFKREICKVGQGTPVTKGINPISNVDLPLIIYDSEGYELGATFSETKLGDGEQNYYHIIFDFIKKQNEKKEPVDVIWYCISAPNARISDVDIEIIKSLLEEKKPTAIVLTQIDKASEEDCDELKEAIKNKLHDINNLKIFESSINESISVEYGLDDLSKWTFNNIDKSRQDAFLYVSNREIEEKYDKSYSYIKLASVSAAAVTLSPIPLTDTGAISAIQIALIAKIFAIWNLEEIKNLIVASISPILIKIIEETLIGNIVKFIPILGTIIGTTINASIAAGITYAVGFTFTESLYELKKDQVNGNLSDISKYFDEEKFKKTIQNNYDRYRNEH